MTKTAAGESSVERQVRRESLCWRCSKAYLEIWQHCPQCGATNANVDFNTAFLEMIMGRRMNCAPNDRLSRRLRSA